MMWTIVFYIDAAKYIKYIISLKSYSPIEYKGSKIFVQLEKIKHLNAIRKMQWPKNI